MDLFAFEPSDILSYFLTLFRISIILFLLPFFGGNSTPKTVKATLVLVLSAALWPQLSFPGDLFPKTGIGISLMILGEVVIGLILAMLVNFLFAAVQFGGQIIGFQMGFAMVNVVDPITGVSNAATAHFLYMCTMLTFLILNGHLELLHAVGMSFEYIPPGGLLLNTEIANHIFEFSKLMFVLAIRIAAPVMVALFLVDLALALIARAAPQMHVLILGFPIKISVGFLFLGIMFSLMSLYVSDFLQELALINKGVMRIMSQGN